MSEPYDLTNPKYDVHLSINTKRVGYAKKADTIFVYCHVGDIMYSLGGQGAYQVSWADEVNFKNIIDLGEL